MKSRINLPHAAAVRAKALIVMWCVPRVLPTGRTGPSGAVLALTRSRCVAALHDTAASGA